MTDVWRFDAIGTRWTITSAESIGDSDRRVVSDLVEAFDATWSRFRADAVIDGLRRGLTVDLGPDAEPILDLCERLDRATAGAMNPLVGVSLEHLGYGPDYSLTPGGGWVAAPDLSVLIRRGSTVSSRLPVVLDIGAVGKGFLAGRVADVLAARGVASVVDAGGDIVNRSGAAISVALEHPGDPTLAIGTARVESGHTICASATNRRAWADGLHHVIDARSGEPVREVVATWAIGTDAATCDGVSTAAFFVGADELAWADARILTLDRRGHTIATDWPGELFD